MLTFDAIGETVFCGTSGDGKAFHMNRLMNFYPQGGMKSVLSLQIENQQIQPLLETINSTDEIYLVDQKRIYSGCFRTGNGRPSDPDQNAGRGSGAESAD